MGLIKTAQPALHGDQHLADGSDPIPGIGGLPVITGTDLEDLILSTGPDAFWKLNETSGTTAHDSSGNSHDLTAGVGFTAPDWGQAAGPPGETTAGWDGDSTKRLSGSLSDFTNNFTAGIWVSIGEAIFSGELLGQGSPYHGGGGWALMAHATSPANKFAVVTTGSALIDANSPYDLDTWYFIAVVRDSGTWKLYVNGLLQAATMTTSPGSSYGSNTWLGNDAYSAHTSYLHIGLLSYAFITSTVLTSTQLLEMYETGTSGGALPAGLVWTSDGAGSASWQPATIEVDY